MALGGFKASNHPQQTAKREPGEALFDVAGARDVTDEVDDRGTDPAFFDATAERFGGFTLDVAAASHNAKCERFYTREDDGLMQPWRGRVWCNPPYSDCGTWVEKAWLEWEMRRPRRDRIQGNESLDLIVMLLPANRVEQAWWQDHVEPYRDRPDSPLSVEFLRGRMRFDRPDWTPGPKGDRPPFGCCLLIWGGAPKCEHDSHYMTEDDGHDHWRCLRCGQVTECGGGCVTT
jgi:phage N-6-adenine-methyltransferase